MKRYKSERKYYKVVRVVDGMYKSLVVGAYEGSCQKELHYAGATRYVIGDTVERKALCGPFAVFRTKKQAIDFLEGHIQSWYAFSRYHFEILKCTGKVSRAKSMWLFSDYFNMKVKRDKDIPDGTVFLDTVTPLESVHKIGRGYTSMSGR